jgi:hypothetical protein
MSHLILLMAVCLNISHADQPDDVPLYPTRAQGYELPMPIEQPAYQPVETQPQPYQSDTDWNASMKAMDLETQPRRGY